METFLVSVPNRRPRLRVTGQRRAFVLIKYALFLALCCGLYLSYGNSQTQHYSRRLEDANSSNSLYPSDLLLTQPYYDSENKYFLILHFMGVLYMFSGLAIVCDDYFVSALDEIVDRFSITPDVAGATFMAAGGSAPELFTSIMGVTVSESDVGFGTIVGSAVFNVLFVIGLCALFAKQTLKLTWWPLFRDCSYYCISLIILSILVSTATTEEGKNSGGEIEFWEALLLLIMYLIYVFIMSKNETCKAFVTSLVSSKRPIVPDVAHSIDDTDPTPAPINGEDELTTSTEIHFIRDVRGAALRSILNGDVERMVKRKLENSQALQRMKLVGRAASKKFQSAASFVAHQARTLSRTLSLEQAAQVAQSADGAQNKLTLTAEPIPDEEDEEDDEDDDPFAWPSTRPAQALFLINLPLQVLLVYTIPNCAKPQWKNWYAATFGISLVWIAIFSFFMVWWAEIIGEALGIPANIMGITFLAAGTSIPDALSSVIVARQGFGDMAVSSSVGSNIFDILFGLPVPWMLKTGIIMRFDGVVLVYSENLITNVLTLLVMVAFVILSIMFFKWELSRMLGFSMFVLYILFLAMSISLEYCNELGLCSN